MVVGVVEPWQQRARWSRVMALASPHVSVTTILSRRSLDAYIAHCFPSRKLSTTEVPSLTPTTKPPPLPAAMPPKPAVARPQPIFRFANEQQFMQRIASSKSVKRTTSNRSRERQLLSGALANDAASEGGGSSVLSRACRGL